MRLPFPRSPLRGSGAFTLIELLLAISIMTVIIIALYSVFDLTQRALRRTLAEVDVLEGIRAASDMLARDFEAAVPVELADTNLTSFAAFLNRAAVSVDLQGLANSAAPILRTAIQDLYMVQRRNDLWTAVGYWVGPSNTNEIGAATPIALGRLYRFQYQTNSLRFGYTNLFRRFDSLARLQTSQPVMDGIIHLRVVAYDAAGRPLLHWLTNNVSTLNPWFPDPTRNTETSYWFRRVNRPRFPSAIELEIGVLEPQLITRFAAIPNAVEARKFLARNSGQIHLFRQRIPLRNAPPN